MIGRVYFELQDELEEGLKELLEVEKYVIENNLSEEIEFEILYHNIGILY